jgi:hypothetical protein
MQVKNKMARSVATYAATEKLRLFAATLPSVPGLYFSYSPKKTKKQQAKG